MPKGTSYFSTARKVLKYLKKYKVLFTISLILAAAIVALTLYIPILVGNAIDLAVGRGEVQFNAIFDILVKIGIIAAVTAIFQWLMNVCNNRITFGIVRRLRRDAFKKIQSLPLSYLDSRAVGDTVSRVIGDVDQFSDGLLMGFSQLFTGVLTIVGTIGIMLSINLTVTAVVVLFDCRAFGFGKCEEIVIPWDKIGCFGKDAVLVNIDCCAYERLCQEKKFEKK